MNCAVSHITLCLYYSPRIGTYWDARSGGVEPVGRRTANAVQWRHEKVAHLTARPLIRAWSILDLDPAPGYLATSVEAARTMVDAGRERCWKHVSRSSRQRMAASCPPGTSCLT